MSMLDMLTDEKVWQKFYRYKTSLVCTKSDIKRLESFINGREYLAVCSAIKNKQPFPLPEKAVINKNHSNKKRIIYMYPEKETIVLKLLTYLLTRKFDGIFAGNLYSFRPCKTAKDAVRRLINTPGIHSKYSYKADISNYFNSISINLLLPRLKKVLWDEPELYDFLRGLLRVGEVIDRGKVISEEKGIMAGTPLSAFYANLYLSELDKWFDERNIIYARYSDDIIVFASGESELYEYSQHIKEQLAQNQLAINPDKECFAKPGDGFTFLGFRAETDKVDIAPVTLSKLKGKMRRKTRALYRWSRKNHISGEKAAAAFIRIFNRKLLESPEKSELSWSYWFFSVITTDESLRLIDTYSQDCLRFLISGKRTKARFNVRYADLKKLGYRSLVHEYYNVKAVPDKD